MRQRKPFYNLEARILAGGVECNWRMAGKPLFREGRVGENFRTLLAAWSQEKLSVSVP